MLRPLRHMSDQELVHMLPHSESAFTEIYNRYWDKLLFVAGLKLPDIVMAEEVVQEIFVDIWNRRTQLSISGSLEAYLSVAVKYRIINVHLKLRREQDFIKTQKETVISPAQQIDEKELYKHYQLLISQLPEKCRITYQLSREEGLSLKEISRTLDVSQKAVEANLTRSLKLLRFGLRKLLFCITGMMMIIVRFMIS